MAYLHKPWVTHRAVVAPQTTSAFDFKEQTSQLTVLDQEHELTLRTNILELQNADNKNQTQVQVQQHGGESY